MRQAESRRCCQNHRPVGRSPSGCKTFRKLLRPPFRWSFRKSIGLVPPRKGDSERGRKLFSADGLGCAKCHAILAHQKGGGAPSLSGAAQRFTLAHLVESILLPNQQVAPLFAATTIVTDEGRSYVGLVIEENKQEVVLLLPTAVRQVVPTRAIETRRTQPASPMPSGLVKTPAGAWRPACVSAKPRSEGPLSRPTSSPEDAHRDPTNSVKDDHCAWHL